MQRVTDLERDFRLQAMREHKAILEASLTVDQVQDLKDPPS